MDQVTLDVATLASEGAGTQVRRLSSVKAVPRGFTGSSVLAERPAAGERFLPS